MNRAETEKFELSERRAAIIDALNTAIEIFTSHSDKEFDNVISRGLKPIANASGLDRVIFYRYLNIDGEKRFGQIYLWDTAKGGLVPTDNNLWILPKIPILERWTSVLLNGDYIRIRESDMTEDELAYLRPFGVKSLLTVPIFSHGELWGSVALQNHTDDSYFDEGCTDLLYSAASLCANAIIREEMSKSANEAVKALKRREIMADTLNKMAVTFLSQSHESFEDMMTDGVKLIADMIDLDRMSVWRNFSQPDGLHSSQIYRWEKKSGGTTVPTAWLEDVTYCKFVPSWENILKNGGTINGPVRLQPEREAATLKRFGIISAFVTPIFISNEFWGLVLFEDHYKERYFEEDYTAIMRSAGFLCANTVIRAEMERNITSANELNTAVVDAARIGFTAFDENLKIIAVNNASLALFGCEKQYYIEHFFEFMPEHQQDGTDSRKKALDLLNRALNGENILAEWTHLTPGGELIPFEISLARAKYKGTYIVLTYQYDLRNIKMMTEELRKQSDLLKARLEQQELISEISRSFVSSGETGTLIKQAIARLGRYHEVSMVLIFSLDYGKENTRLAYHWSDDSSLMRLAEFDLFGLVKSNFPERLYDRATVPVLSCTDTTSSNIEAFHALSSVNVSAFICAPLYVEGCLWGIIAVEQCNNPRTWTDNEKSFVAMTASTIAGAIMLDIYNTKLKDAVKKLTAASKAKSEFLSNMSHEMRTPMNAIINMTAIAKNANDIERKNYALDKIGDASSHLLGVINDILDMSKIEANKFELAPVEFDFEKMLQRVVNVVNFRVEEKHQKLMVYVDKNIPKTLIADDQRLSQIITNLMGNAVKFTPDNGSITLDTKFLGEENGICTLQISVTDTGIGISAEQQKRLFQSFQQAESSTVRKYGGTGLGLSISKSIAEMMNGKIWVESEPGKGSTFAFTIQAKRGEDKKQSLRERTINWDVIRVLAVDDDPDILAFFMDVAQRFNIHCDTAPGGEYALKLVEGNGNYNIYFIDWKMPGMDGIALTNALKSKERNPENAIIIMISAAEWTDVKDEAQKAGVDRFLSKPLFPSAVIDIMSECLGVERHQAESTEQSKDDFTGHKILLVEDVEINREIVLTLLEPTHLKIDCAENGVQAVKMFSEDPEKYDMIFMDVQMPEMDGYEATRRIRIFEDEWNNTHEITRKWIPIIAMTANVFKEDIENCKKAGMDDHVGKPLDFEIVMEKLRTYLKQAKTP
jgi:signal transduction histidine kinase/CheY-like chemotaxis protein/PAS domain-containing protein